MSKESIALAIILILLMITAFSCASLSNHPQPVPSPPEVLYRTVVKTNWLATAAIIGISVGVFLCWTDLKLGLAGISSCFTMLAMTLATARFAIWFAVGGMVIPAGLLVYAIFIKKKAIKEIIQGGENFKRKINKSVYNTIKAGQVPDLFNSTQEFNQSPSTQKIVKKVKKEKKW